MTDLPLILTLAIVLFLFVAFGFSCYCLGRIDAILARLKEHKSELWRAK